MIAVWIAVGVGLLAIGVLAWGWFEAGWLRKRVLEVALDGVPSELDGLRIAHLSDFHLGVPSRGRRAVEEAVLWVEGRRPDLVVVTGDLLSRNAGIPELERLLRRLAPCFVVLGNHDFADSRDPFSQRVDPAVFGSLDGVVVLADEALELELRGNPVQIVGVDPRTYAARRAEPQLLADADAALRILLCHFPGIARRIPADAFHLDPGRALPRGSGRRALPWREAQLRPSADSRRRGPLPLWHDRSARLSRPRDHVRTIPLLRPARGHRAGCTIGLGWSGGLSSPQTCSRATHRIPRCAVGGVAGLANGPLSRGKSVAVSGDEDTLAIELHLELEWGQNAAEVGKEVQRRVSEYLERMASVTPASVEVAFGTVSAPPPRR